jgi:hypothetical protein
MEIFIKNLNGKVQVLDVEPGMTIAELTAMAGPRVFPGGGPPVGRRFALKPGDRALNETAFLDGTRTLAQCGISDGNTLGWCVIEAPVTYDPEVKTVLAADLGQLAALRGPQIVFVGIGSACTSNNSDENLRYQQCPPALLDMCRTSRCGLTILLIDIEFATADRHQIYHVDRSWGATQTSLGERVRRFTHGPTGARLVTYGTMMPTGDYGSTPFGVITPNLPISLADVRLVDTFAPMLTRATGALIVGDFSCHRPHLLAGDAELLARLGYSRMNPYEHRVIQARQPSGMYRLTTRAHLRQLPAELRGALNQAGKDVTITLIGTRTSAPAKHWAWESDQVIRVECAQNLVDLHDRARRPGLLVQFANTQMSIRMNGVDHA